MAAAVGFVGGMFGIGAGAAFGVAGGAAFGGWIAGAAWAGGLLGGLTVNLLGTVALSALSRALAPEPEQGGGITISSTVAGEQNSETIILGRYATGGAALCPPYSHGPSNRYLTHIIELCSAPGAQFDRIMLGAEWVELGANGLSEYGRPVLGDKYGGHVWVKYLDGSQTAADPMLRAKYGSHPDRPWTADMIGAGLCIAILTFYYDPEVLAQVPRYRFELTGIPVYDIRRDSSAGGVGPQRLDDPSTWAVSHNPIVLAWNVMRGIALPGGDVWGGNINDLRRLPQAVWVAAMNRCDVTVEGADGPEPMYRAGLEVLLTSPPAAALEELFKACSAVFADLGYGYGVTVGGPALPVYSITDADIIVSAPEERDPFPGLDDSYNAVTAKYPDPAHFWETREAPQLTHAGYEAADRFGRRMATLSLPAAPYLAQVQRLLGPWLEDARRDLRHNITLPPDSAHVELIDSLLWTSAHNLYEGKAFTIHEIVEDPFTGLRQMAIREVDPGDYVIPPDYLLPSPPSPSAPAVIPATVDGYDVQPVTLLDGASKARRAGIRILWSPTLAGSGLRWRVRVAGQTEPVLHGTIQALGDGYVDLYEGVLAATAYQVQAELITDRPAVPTAWLPVTTDDVRLSLDDLSAEVGQQLADLEGWMSGYPAEVETAIQQARDDMAGARQEVADALQVVGQDVADARQLALESLDLAYDYTDTSLLSESIARQAGLEALAAQVQALTAVLNSENYLQNPRFADGIAGWTTITGAMTVMDRDEASPDPIIATAPTPRFALRSTPVTNAHALEQTFEIETEPGEVVQWRIWLAAAAVIPVQIRYFWLDDLGTQIGAVIDRSVTITPNEWRVYSGQYPRPDGATRLRFNILRGSTTSTTGETAQLAVADASVTKVDVSLMARITNLEVVVANSASAMALWQTEAESRFGGIEGELDAVAIAMDSRYTKAEADAATAASSSQLGVSLSDALARSPVGLVGKADRVLRPFGTSSAGTVEAYGTMPASAYGEDADGPYVTRATSTGANGVYLRATAPAHNDAVYRVTYRIAPLADLDFRFRASWLAMDGSAISGTSMATRALLAADGLQEISVVVGRYSGGLVDVAVGGSNWVTAHMLRFGLDNWPATPGEAYRVYEIRVDDLSGKDSAARQIATVQASITSEQVARVTADTALAGRATALETRMGTAETRITDETTARSTADTALAGRATALETRMGTAETRITDETTARSTADTALGMRATALETTTGNHAARIGTTELAISNQTDALATLTQQVEARSLGQDLVFDGVFAEGFAWWPTGTLTLAANITEIFPRNPDSTVWQRQRAPAAKVLRIDPSDAGKWRGAGREPVTPGEEILVKFDAARWSANCVGVSVVLYCYDLAGNQIPGAQLTLPVAAGASAYRSISARTLMPANAATAQLAIHATGSGATTSAYITNLRALRGQQAYASGALKVSSEVTPAGAVSRIGLRAWAEGEAVGEAAVYIEAGSDGTSRIINNARQFYVFDGGLRQALLAIRDGKIVMANAIVDTLSIGANQITVPASASASSEIRLTGSAEQTLLSVTVDRKGAPTMVWASVQMGGYVSQSIASFRLYRGTTMLASFPAVTGSRGAQTGTALSWRDANTGTGPTTYYLKAQRLVDGDYSGDPQILNRSLMALHVMR